jgi:hypothetical protein
MSMDAVLTWASPLSRKQLVRALKILEVFIALLPGKYQPVYEDGTTPSSHDSVLSRSGSASDNFHGRGFCRALLLATEYLLILTLAHGSTAQNIAHNGDEKRKTCCIPFK